MNAIERVQTHIAFKYIEFALKRRKCFNVVFNELNFLHQESHYMMYLTSTFYKTNKLMCRKQSLTNILEYPTHRCLSLVCLKFIAKMFFKYTSAYSYLKTLNTKFIRLYNVLVRL